MALKGTVRLLRLPLFVTAVADSVAGYAVGAITSAKPFEWDRVAMLAGVSTGLYLFGMVQNDLADRRRDRLMGLDRPLVTGQVSVATAVVLLLATALLAGVCAAMLKGGSLVLAIGTFAAVNLYNLGAKRGPAYVAMGVMGLCRLLNFGIGAAAAAGVPKPVTLALFLPDGPLWVRHGAALFFTTMVVTGYSICARLGRTVSTRPWQGAFIVAGGAGFLLIAASMSTVLGVGRGLFVPPVARVFAVLLLAGLWPGGLWSPMGRARRPEEYGRFIERALYWMILLDAAFVVDALMIR